MASQLARSACSVPANIAEGVGQPSPLVCARHLGIAIGSLNESDTHLRVLSQLSKSVGDIEPLLVESRHLRRMLFALRDYHLARGRQSTPTSKSDES